MSSSPKTAIVTGASQGIGAGIVKAFVERGFNVVADSRKMTASTEVAASDYVALADGEQGVPVAGEGQYPRDVNEADLRVGLHVVRDRVPGANLHPCPRTGQLPPLPRVRGGPQASFRGAHQLRFGVVRQCLRSNEQDDEGKDGKAAHGRTPAQSGTVKLLNGAKASGNYCFSRTNRTASRCAAGSNDVGRGPPFPAGLLRQLLLDGELGDVQETFEVRRDERFELLG